MERGYRIGLAATIRLRDEKDAAGAARQALGQGTTEERRLLTAFAIALLAEVERRSGQLVVVHSMADIPANRKTLRARADSRAAHLPKWE